MDKLKQLIRKIIKEQQEYDAPGEIVTALEDKIQMNPIERFVEKFKSPIVIPATYFLIKPSRVSVDEYES